MVSRINLLKLFACEVIPVVTCVVCKARQSHLAFIHV